MEALWNLEDKFKVSTKAAAIALCVCASSLLIATVWVVAGILLRRAKGSPEIQEPRRCTEVKKVLMRSVLWSGACKWEEGEKRRRRREGLSPPLLLGEVGWQSNNSDSPVWQRPILMGEKCELPRFSGLILYDDEGRPLHNCHNNASSHHNQVDISAANPAIERVTLKDFLL